MEKQAWIELVERKSKHYLNLGDGGFDENMKARLMGCNYEEQSVTYRFQTQPWQINERGGIHGGAIAGMFDTAFGVVANLTAGDNEATTTDMTVYIVKAGRSLIRQRAELKDAATGKLLAIGSGTWMPL